MGPNRHQSVIGDTDKPQSSWNWSVGGMTCFQDINDMDEPVSNIVASFKEVLVPFVRVNTVAGMAIHSREGFRLLIRWGSDMH